MGGKKKGSKGQGKGKKAAKKEEPDDMTAKLTRLYRRKLKEFGCSMPLRMREKLEEINDEKNPGKLTEVILWENVGGMGIKAIFDSLRELLYPHTKQIRMWQANIQDEGARSMAMYIEKSPQVRLLEIMDCKLSPLSCDFIGRFLGIDIKHPMESLKLDHSSIGDEGMLNLSKGLSMNNTLQYLSLAFCDITAVGARGILEILIFTKSVVKEIDLQGNYLQDEGAEEVFSGLSINTSCEKINVSENGFTDVALLKFASILPKNSKLKNISMRHNAFTPAGADLLTQAINAVDEEGNRYNRTITIIDMPTELPAEKLKEVQEALSQNKPKRKGKGKRGKGKKKGKKR